MRICPSVLNADLANLASEVARIGNADALHLDVMDAHFVPNLTFGLPMVEALRQHTTVPMDMHLMIADPDRWAPPYAEAGCESVTFHLEAAQAPVRLARELHRLGARAAVALNPGTDVTAAAPLLDEVDMVLLMSVEPGFGGQSFLELVVPKIRQLRQLLGGREMAIEVDGGISAETIERCAEAGADTFVSGSAVFRSDDPAATIDHLRSLATAAADGA